MIMTGLFVLTASIVCIIYPSELNKVVCTNFTSSDGVLLNLPFKEIMINKMTLFYKSVFGFFFLVSALTFIPH